MSTGQMIKAARQRSKVKLEEVALATGVSTSSMSGYENDRLKGEIPRDVLIKIAETLNDVGILVHHCQTCPVRQHVFLKQFPDLNNIRRDPAVIAARLRKEMIEAADSLDRLTERFSDRDFKSRSDYQEIFEREMEQVIDVKRNIEILEFELVLSGLHSSRDLRKVYDNQQKKCIEHGHHIEEAVR